MQPFVLGILVIMGGMIVTLFAIQEPVKQPRIDFIVSGPSTAVPISSK